MTLDEIVIPGPAAARNPESIITPPDSALRSAPE
jgi:hypothetical protein